MSVSIDNIKDGLGDLIAQLEELKSKAVYVGIPAEKNADVGGETQFNLAAKISVGCI